MYITENSQIWHFHEQINLSSLNKIIFLLILSITLILHFYYSIHPINSFHWLAFLDLDTIYQVERFLIIVHYEGIQQFNSSNVDYGSVFYLLIPFFRFYELFISLSDPVHAYYFLTTLHLVCGVTSIILADLFLKSRITILSYYCLS